MKKYIFVTGGVCSSLGKGLASASLGTLLESRGLSVRMIKIDPYINVDAGTMSPFQHGEIYVTEDGAETDLDLGNYARFTSSPLSKANSITTGQIYDRVIRKEREGKYLGKCVQVVPHITDEIKRRIYSIGEAEDVDVTIIEVGGTVGDIESIPYLEAVRQIIHEKGDASTVSVHLSLIPTLKNGEIKTKPTQHTVKSMRELGIQPKVLLCRSDEEIDIDIKKKISMFTNIKENCVISAYDVNTTIYEIPIMYHKQGLDNVVVDLLGLKTQKANLNDWKKLVDIYNNAKTTLNIAVVGKYIQLDDAYKSVDEAIVHGAFANNAKVKITKIDSEEIESVENLDEIFKDIDGILVPSGFGGRGIQGMIDAATYARVNNIPYFGICLGMQTMVIEYARNVLGWQDANSSEFKPEGERNVISNLEELSYGGTMRLGLGKSVLVNGTNIAKAYGQNEIVERHRHRYEVANQYKEEIFNAGLILSGTTTDGLLVESVEWPNHIWSVGVQFQPEFTSRPIKAGPLFKSFMQAALKYKKNK